MELRIDNAPGSELQPPEIGPDGAVHTQGYVARAGIYEYMRTDGTVKRELVLPEDLFAPESLATLANAALTLEHPPEFLTPANARQFAVGHVHETVDAVDAPENSTDFAYARVRLTARTRDAVERLTSGRKIWTSPGYSLPAYKDTAGVHPVWGAYDAIQGPRIYNHLALTERPRGGSSMMVRIDSAGDSLAVQATTEQRTDPASWVKDEALWEKAKKAAAEQGKGSDYAYVVGIYKQMGGRIDALPKSQSGGKTVETVRIDGVDFMLEPALAALLKGYLKRKDEDVAMQEQKAMSALDQLNKLQQQMQMLQEKINMAVKAQEEAEGKAEATNAQMMDAMKKADALAAELANPQSLRTRLAPRLALEAQARDVLPKDRHDGIEALSDRQIREAMVKTYQPNAVVEGRSDDYLAGMLSTLTGKAPVAQTSARNDSTSTVIPTSTSQVYQQRHAAALKR